MTKKRGKKPEVAPAWRPPCIDCGEPSYVTATLISPPAARVGIRVGLCHEHAVRREERDELVTGSAARVLGPGGVPVGAPGVEG